MRVLLALHRVGPYHHARFEQASSLLDLHVLETRPNSKEYPWTFLAQGAYSIHRLSAQSHSEADPPQPDLQLQLQTVLDQLQPQVIVSVGWADRAYQQLLVLGKKRRLPLVLVSDSRQRDEPRNFAKEWIKRQLLRGYSAALVAGTESRQYLQGLGFSADAIFEPWDVVDNGFFEREAAACTSAEPHFLCVSRLVAKKNHAGLLAAYSAYQQQGGRWALYLVGSGPLQSSIRAQIDSLPDPSRVQLLPFCQLEQIGQHLGHARAFVLASSTDQWGLVVNEAMAAGLPCLVSNACGCAVDLIEHGVNGWCFDPFIPSELTDLMHRAEHQSAHDCQLMLAAARRRLESYSLKAFTTGLVQAVVHAMDHPRHSRRAAGLAQLLISCL